MVTTEIKTEQQLNDLLEEAVDRARSYRRGTEIHCRNLETAIHARAYLRELLALPVNKNLEASLIKITTGLRLVRS